MSDCEICGKIIRNDNYSKNIALDNMVADLINEVC